jgi:MYXO-CTERM domain-containing protein
MRRAWLLALAAAALVGSTAGCDPNPDAPPTDAEAPPPAVGQITFPTIPNSPVDGFINVAECQGGSIKLKALFPTNSTPSSYQLYAANDDAVFDPDNPNECQQTVPDNAQYVVGAVDVERTDGISGDLVNDVVYLTSTMVSAAGKTCDVRSDIFLCFEALRGATKVGTARVTLSVVVDKPNAPVVQSVTPGNGALNVRWDPVNPGLNESYAVVTRTTDPLDPAVVGSAEVVRTSPQVAATELRVRDLTNGAVYGVQVVAFSDADNPSDVDPLNATSASPVPVADFWQAYKAAGGREQGGCSTGGAGLGALVVLAALAAMRRRS